MQSLSAWSGSTGPERGQAGAGRFSLEALRHSLPRGTRGGGQGGVLAGGALEPDDVCSVDALWQCQTIQQEQSAKPKQVNAASQGVHKQRRGGASHHLATRSASSTQPPCMAGAPASEGAAFGVMVSHRHLCGGGGCMCAGRGWRGQARQQFYGRAAANSCRPLSVKL